MIRQFSNICIIGFGASSLNVRALTSSLQSTKKPLMFLDSLDPLYVSTLLARIDATDTAFIVITKSGNTHETNVLLEYLLGHSYLKHNNLFILGSEGDSVTYNLVRDKPHIWISYPPTPSGRFSLLEAPFLDIAYSLGVEIEKLLEAASTATELEAEKIANRWVKNYQEGRKVWVVINYNKQLEGLLLWIRQITGESLGKNQFGITPFLAEGSMDEHSQLQLFLDGPDDKFYDIISSDYQVTSPTLANAHNYHASMTSDMLKDKGRDVIHSHHPIICEAIVGKYIGLYKNVITRVADLMGLDPYSQPAVENIKQHSNEI